MRPEDVQLLLVTFLLCNFYATLTVCINCALHYSYGVRTTFKVGKTYKAGYWFVANFPSGEVEG